MTDIKWSDLDNSKKSIRVGDKVYHDRLLLGTIEKIRKPLFAGSTVTMAIASYEAKEFIWSEKGLNDISIAQLIPTRWTKLKMWVRNLLKVKKNEH